MEEQNQKQQRKWLSKPFQGYGVAVVLVAAATAGRLVFLASLGTRVTYLTFYPAVILAALFGGLPAGLLATALSALSAYFFIEPAGSFSVQHSAGWLGMAIFVLSSVMISIITQAMHRARGHAQSAETEARLAAEIRRQREWLGVTLHSIGDAVIATDRDGRVTLLNPVAEQATGWKSDEAAGRSLSEVFNIINEQTRKPADNPVARVLREGVVVGLANHTVLIGKDGRELPIEDSAAPIRDAGGNIIGIVMVFHDVTEKRQRDGEREITVEFLHLVNEATGIGDLVHKATTFFREKSGCEAVGIRMGDDYPYYETHDPAKSFFTERGSFWTNSTTELLASTTEADRQGRTLNRCNGEGYESVALFPLKVGQEHLGLLQLNDRRKGLFSPETVILWERLADKLALALSRFRAEEELRESEGKYRSLFENMLDGYAHCKMLYDDQGRPENFVYLDVNNSFGRLTGLENVVGKKVTEVIPGIKESNPEIFEIYGRVASTGRPERFEAEVKPLEKWLTISVYSPAREYFVAVFDNITERKRAEEALRKYRDSLEEQVKERTAELAAERQRFVDVLETLPAMVCLLTADYHIAFANRTFREKFGESNGRRCYDYCFGKSAPCDFCESYKVLETGEPHHWEVKTPDGSSIISAHDYPFTDVDGTPMILEMDIDITEQRRTEEILRAGLRLSEYSLTHSLDELITMALDETESLTGSGIGFFHFVEADQRTLRLQTWSTNTLNKMCTAEGKGNHYPIDKAGVWVDAVKERAPVIHNDYASLPGRKGLPPGHVPVIRELVVPFIRSGQVMAVVGVGNKPSEYGREDIDSVQRLANIAWDIISAKQAESALADQSRKSEAFLKHSLSPLAFLDREFNFIHVNDAYAKACGREASDFIGHNHFVDYPSDELKDKFERVVKTKEPYSVFSRPFAFPDHPEWGTTYWDLFVYPVLDGAGEVDFLVFSLNDVTERRRIEEEALRSQKLESLRVLAGGIAHDLNNMMVAVEANAGLALRVVGEGSPARGYLTGIEDAAEKVAAFSKQILSFTGKSEEVKEPVQLNDMVMDTARLLMASISKKAELEYNLADDLPAIMAHPQNMQQLAMNLIINASDALGGDRGTIRVSTGKLHADRQYLDTLHPSGLPEGEYVYLEVSDTGCGMSPETRKKIFDPFFTTKFTGRGLGLSSVFGIAKGHGGAIGLESEEGRGATFRVHLPVPARAVAAAAKKPAFEEIHSGQGTILVVDDEIDPLFMAKAVLDSYGYKVLTAMDGSEAIEIFRENKDSINAVLMDLIMPHVRGDEAAMEIRKIRGDANIILLSGYHDVKLDDLMEGPGRTVVLAKPYKIAALISSLQEVMEA